jgi:hypothetical protein
MNVLKVYGEAKKDIVHIEGAIEDRIDIGDLASILFRLPDKTGIALTIMREEDGVWAALVRPLSKTVPMPPASVGVMQATDASSALVVLSLPEGTIVEYEKEDGVVTARTLGEDS